MNGFQLRFSAAYETAKNMSRQSLIDEPIAYTFHRGYAIHDIRITSDARGHLITFYNGRKSGYNAIIGKLKG